LNLIFLFRAAIAIAHDVIAVGLAWGLSYLLRFNLDLPEFHATQLLATVPWVMGVHGIIFWLTGLYRGIWRYASLPDLKRILFSVTLASLAVPTFFLVVALEVPVPRSVFLMMPILLVVMMGGSRLSYRLWKEGRLRRVDLAGNAKPVLVLGTGSVAASLLKDLAQSAHWRVVGLLDNDGKARGREIVGTKVLGGIDEISRLATSLGVSQAIIAMPEETHQTRKRAVDVCASAGIQVMTVPSYADLVSGKVSISALRNVELDDLLGRDPVALDDAGLQDMLRGETVLVTGAGGSIGSELCRQIARYSPSRVVFLELSEFALYTIEQEFRDSFPDISVCAVIGDVKDRKRITNVFSEFRPRVVFHAAAYKHVPLMEEQNAWQAVQNNVQGTLTLARAASAAGVKRFVLISTDKAVNPTNVMGATKRLAELVCQDVQATQSGEQQPASQPTTQFIIVRFGNVLGSTGSVIPRFRAQIAAGGPVTVTHPDIQRYFMSIPEAAQLVLQASLMGASGQIFVLDMGEPVKIVDLARQLILLSGLAENDIRIEFTGLRPGEKLFEELLADTEQTLPTPHPKLRMTRARDEGGPQRLAQIEALLGGPGLADAEVRAALQRWVPEYVPSVNGKSSKQTT